MVPMLLTNKDIQLLTGKGKAAAIRLSKKIRQRSGKDPRIPITIYEFSDYMRVRPDIVSLLLSQRRSL